MSTNYKTNKGLKTISTCLIICILFLASQTSKAQQSIAGNNDNQITFKHNHISIEYARLPNTSFTNVAEVATGANHRLKKQLHS